jgi:glutamyl-tRNA reductase
VHFLVVGINHRTASLEHRERFAVAGSESARVCRSLTASEILTECVVLSTCNRVEVYSVVPEGCRVEEALTFIIARLGSGELTHYQYLGRDALEHLLRVASSLDSMVVGEPQILGQLKEAYQLADEAGTVGPLLRRNFSHAFHTAKQIRTETDIGRAAVSVGHVAVELAKTIFGDVQGAHVLLIGAGKMGVLAAENLARSGANKVTVLNRTLERAQVLAAQHDWTADGYPHLEQLLSEVDVVICATGSPQHVLTHAMLKGVLRKRRFKTIFLIDIAVPRDVEPECGELDNVYLYNIDDLEAASRTNADGRQEAVADAERVIENDLNHFEWKSRERLADPVIKQLRDKMLHIAHTEAQKALGRMKNPTDIDAAVIEKLAEVIAERIARDPILALKGHRGRGGTDDLEAMVTDLFGLDATVEADHDG